MCVHRDVYIYWKIPSGLEEYILADVIWRKNMKKGKEKRRGNVKEKRGKKGKREVKAKRVKQMQNGPK
jgi:hypothetical protein